MGDRKINRVYLGTDAIISSLGCGTLINQERIERYDDGLSLTNDPALFPSAFQCGRIPRQAETATIECLTRLESLFVQVIQDVLNSSGINPGDQKVGLMLATTKGNIDLLESGHVEEPALFLSETGKRIARHLGFINEPVVISNACISGVSAMIVAQRAISDDKFDHVIVAGGDLLTRFVVSGFQSFRSLSAQPCKPYDQNRDGLTLGEAFAAVLLTNDKKLAASPIVVVEGGGISNDANHISGPSRTGDGLEYAIRQAMDEAGREQSEISFVNGHGTATLFNDEMESKAIHLAGLNEVPVNGLKSYFGHTLGASGVMEAILSACQLRKGILYGTKGFEECGVPMHLNLSAKHREIPMKSCLKLASGFGGCNAAVLLGLEKEDQPYGLKSKPVEIRETAVLSMTNGEDVFHSYIRERYQALNRPDRKFFKMDDQSKLGYIGSVLLANRADFKEMNYNPEEVALIVANRSSSLDTDKRHWEIVCAGLPEGASPAVFVYTLPNIVAGEMAIANKWKGESTFFIEEEPDGYSLTYAKSLLKREPVKAVIYVWCDYLDGKGDMIIKWLRAN